MLELLHVNSLPWSVCDSNLRSIVDAWSLFGRCPRFAKANLGVLTFRSHYDSCGGEGKPSIIAVIIIMLSSLDMLSSMSAFSRLWAIACAAPVAN